MGVTKNRDRAIDVVRGFAIFSMVSAHLATGALIAKPTHSVPYFSGASAFYLLSGLLLAMVNRRKFDEAGSGTRLLTIATLKRLRIVYVSQLFICAVAAVAVWGYLRETGLRPLEGTGWPKTVWLVVSLQYAPPGGNALRLYVVFMVLAVFVFFAMAAKKYGWVLLASSCLYVIGLIYDDSSWLTLPTYNDAETGANWATWQALFVPAMVLGWLWNEHSIAARLQRNWLILLLAAAFTCLLSIVLHRIDRVSTTDDFLSGGQVLGPGRLVVGYLLVGAVYLVVTWLIPRVWNWLFRPIELIGQRSLDSYVIQAVALMVLPPVAGYDWSEVKATALVIGILAVCWGWSYVRSRFGIVKLHRFHEAFGSRGRGKTRSSERSDAKAS
jgi:hypothetical protein